MRQNSNFQGWENCPEFEVTIEGDSFQFMWQSVLVVGTSFSIQLAVKAPIQPVQNEAGPGFEATIEEEVI